MLTPRRKESQLVKALREVLFFEPMLYLRWILLSLRATPGFEIHAMNDFYAWRSNLIGVKEIALFWIAGQFRRIGVE